MLRENLTPSLSEAAVRFARNAWRPDGGTGNGNVGVTSGGDVTMWGETAENAAGPETGIPDHVEGRIRFDKKRSLDDIGRKVERVESVVKNLQAGVSTQGRWNTVSTSDAPGSADGYPDGAWWTKIASEDSLAPVALWTVANGRWETRPVPAGTQIISYTNSGIVDAGLVAAAVIKSDEFWTAMSGARVGFNKDGFQAYDDEGKQTVDIDGDTNRFSGEFEAGDWTMKKIGQTSGLFAKTNFQLSEQSPGLVHVGSGVEGVDNTYVAMRSYLYGDSFGAKQDESLNAYFMATSAYRSGDTISVNPQRALMRCVGVNRTSEAYADVGGAAIELRDNGGLSSKIDAGAQRAGITFTPPGWNSRYLDVNTNGIHINGESNNPQSAQIWVNSDGTVVLDGVIGDGSAIRSFFWANNSFDLTAGRNITFTFSSLPEKRGAKWFPLGTAYDWTDEADVTIKTIDSDVNVCRVKLHVQNGVFRRGSSGIVGLLVRRPAW